MPHPSGKIKKVPASKPEECPYLGKQIPKILVKYSFQISCLSHQCSLHEEWYWGKCSNDSTMESGSWWCSGADAWCQRAHTCTMSVPLPLVLGLASAVEETWTVSHLALKQGQGSVSRWFLLGPDLTSGLKTQRCGHRATPGKTATVSWKSHGCEGCCISFLQLAFRGQQMLYSLWSTFTYVLASAHNPGKEGRRYLRFLSKLKNSSSER